MVILLFLILMAILYPDMLRGIINRVASAIAWPFLMIWRITARITEFAWYLIAGFFKWIFVI